MQNQFHKGLSNVRAALNDAIIARGVANSMVECNVVDGEPRDACFAITANGKTESQVFTREEIEDSGEAIDAPVAIKVRMLVSHFVR